MPKNSRRRKTNGVAQSQKPDKLTVQYGWRMVSLSQTTNICHFSPDKFWGLIFLHIKNVHQNVQFLHPIWTFPTLSSVSSMLSMLKQTLVRNDLGQFLACFLCLCFMSGRHCYSNCVDRYLATALSLYLSLSLSLSWATACSCNDDDWCYRSSVELHWIPSLHIIHFILMLQNAFKV